MGLGPPALGRALPLPLPCCPNCLPPLGEEWGRVLAWSGRSAVEGAGIHLLLHLHCTSQIAGIWCFFFFELVNHTFCAIVSPCIPAHADGAALRAAESSHSGLEWAELSGTLDVMVEKPRPCKEREMRSAVPPGLSLQPLPSVMTNLGLRGWGYPYSGPGAVPEVKVSLMLSPLAEIPESFQQGPRDREGAGWVIIKCTGLGSASLGTIPKATSSWSGPEGGGLCPHTTQTGSLVLWPQARLSLPSMVCWGCRCYVLQQEGPLLCPAS